MNGYHIKPLGWIALITLVGVTLYFVIKWLRHPPRRQSPLEPAGDKGM